MESIAAEPIHIVYFGTPAYAVPALQALASESRVMIDMVVTQPDRPAGRGRKLTAPPVKKAAETLGFAVYQPEALRTAADRDPIASVQADLFVVAAFGKIFGPKLLGLPKMGSVNLHASILPDFRGASPISAAILEGNFRTGVTLMGMDVGLDTGPVLAQRSLDILPDDTTASLTPRLAQLGADLLIDSLDDLMGGRLRPESQDDTEATITRPLVKADGWIDWSMPAISLERQVRAMWDWPRAWTTLDGVALQVHRASVVAGSAVGKPGSVTIGAAGAMAATGDGGLVLEIVQLAGSRPMEGRLVLERAADAGLRLGVEGGPERPSDPLIRPAVD